jgi:YYY domain-containing protein
VADALLLWLLVVGIGIVALPFAEVLFGRLPGRGFVLARPLGLLLVSFPVWLLASLHVVPYRRAGAAVSLAVVALVAVLLWRRGLGRPRGGARSVWLAGEAVFTTAYFLWALLRSFAPEVWQTEKPMDMALVNAVNRSDWFPPHDPWQAGTDVNYYYYGHYLVGLLLRLTGIDPAVGYNLAVALVYALMAAAVFGVAAVVYEAARREGDAPPRSPIIAGLAATCAAAALGNIAGGIQYLHDPARFATYDWWSPSRVIAGTANEFPFFSFLLGDLHAHTLVTPFALVSMAYAVQLALHGPPRLGVARHEPRVAAELLLAALVLGSTYAMNSFDFPTAVLLGVGGLVLWGLEAPGRARRALAWGSCWVGAAVLLYAPFWRSFSPPASSIGLVHEHTLFSRFARDYAYIYGLSLWVVLALFVGRLQLPRRYLAWSGALLLFVLVLLAPPRLAGLTVALMLAGAAVYFTFATGPASQPLRVVWLITAVALALLAAGEVVYLRDVFAGTASFRFNTVFKTGYQAWFLLSIVAGVGVLWSKRWLGRRLRIAWLVVLCGLVALGLVYPVAGWYSRTNRFSSSPTLDGMAWLRKSTPHDAAAIDWLRRSVDGTPTVLETVGPDFDPTGRARVSTFTGLPAVMGWAGHEVQWGHDPGTRLADVQAIYRSRDLEETALLLRRYGVRYVFVGALERRDYPAASLRKFTRIGKPVFRSGPTVVYELPAARLEAAARGRTR